MWKYAFYPLDAAESQYGGWVGLSDIAPLGNGNFLVLERDNQAGPDAAIKRIYQINLADFTFDDGTTIEKVLIKDIYEDLAASMGSIIEKVEGLAVTKSGAMWVNSDNDGVDDSSGEHQLMNVGELVMADVPVPPPARTEPPLEESEGPTNETSGGKTAATTTAGAVGMVMLSILGF